MTETPIQRLHDQLDAFRKGSTKLYFITRIMKEGVKKSAKVMDKFGFKTYQVDINDEVRNELFDTARGCIKYLIDKESNFNPYEVINDGTDVLMTYSMSDKLMSFKEVVENQLPGTPPRIKNLGEIVSEEELWAYAIGMYTTDRDWTYTFRKVLKSKVAIDEKQNGQRTQLTRSLRTFFNTTTQKLELIEGDTVVLDKVIDCFYFEGIFYVHKQTQFEQIVGLEEEFRAQAEQVVGDLEASGLFEGIEIMKTMLEDKAMHKKLVRLTKLGLYRRVDAKALRKMVQVAKRQGLKLNVADGKFVLNEKTDVDLAIKMLCAYFKKDEVFGDSYGTFSGTKLEVLSAE